MRRRNFFKAFGLVASASLLPFKAWGDKGEGRSQAPARKVELQGNRNTRGLGSIPLGNGSVFRNGMVFRSGALCFITKADAEKLLGFKIKTVVDLRIDREIAREGPDKPYFLSGIPNPVRLPMTNSRGLGQEAYHYLIRENATVISSFFKLLASEDNYPLLFHCSAGKDRTGILTALLLEMLGADRDTIMDDYLESRRNSPALKVHEEWINESFEYVDKNGGINSFLQNCGVTLEQMKLISSYLKVSR